MAVLKRKRGISKLEFYNNARELRRDLTAYLLRNFGVKSKIKNIPITAPETQTTIDDEVAIPDEFPEWILSEFRRNIMQILRNLMMNITAANSIYPSPMVDPKTPNVQKMPEGYVNRVQSDELADRRRYQTAAIVNCQQLIQELQYFMDVFSLRYDTFTIDARKFIPFIEKIEFEIRLLKGWRKSTNELAKKIIKGEKY